MYICESSVVIAGIASNIEEASDTHAVRSRTLDALKQITNRFDDVPTEKLAKAFREMQQHHEHHDHM